MVPNNSFLKNTAIPHLQNQMKRAGVVLFTGAGFSQDAATNVTGKPIPCTGVLCRILWKIAYGQDPVDEQSRLQDIYEAALKANPNEVDRQLRSAFTVEPDSIHDWVFSYFRQPWHKVYTLNIDNLMDAVNQNPGLPREVISISAMRDPDHREHSPDRFLKAIHLNGDLTDLPDNVTFSHTQYAQRLADADPFYDILAAELMARSFVFVGTNIEESPLWQSIERRLSKGPRGSLEGRLRSYLVMPKLDRARRDRLDGFNVSWLPMTAQHFATDVLPRLGGDAPTGFDFLAVSASAGRNRLQEVSELMDEPTGPSMFFLGAQPRWSDIHEGRAIKRAFDDDLLREARLRLRRPGLRGVLFITGTAGSGKTTSLMRLALQLMADRYRVAWVDETTDVSSGNIVDGMSKAYSPLILAIDEGEYYGTNLSQTLRRLARLPSRPLVIVAVRSGRIDNVLDRVTLDGIPSKELDTNPLTDNEIDDLIDTLDHANRLGRLKGMSRQQQRREFKKHSDRQLLVALIRATQGQKLRDKIGEEYEDLSPEAKVIYATVSLATRHGYPLDRDEIVQAVPRAMNVQLSAINRLRDLGLLLDQPRTGGLRVRHRIVAEHMIEFLRVQGQLAGIVEALGRFAATIADIRYRQNREYRLCRSLMHNELVKRTLERDARVRAFYDEIEADLADDYHFWLQRGSFEVKHGALELAKHFLDQARALDPDDALVANEYAYWQFKKANVDQLSDEAEELVRCATDTLLQLIGASRASSYPYHVLGSQGLRWSRRPTLGSHERASYLRGLIAHVQNGVKRFPQSEMLRGILDALKEEHLLIAVKP